MAERIHGGEDTTIVFLGDSITEAPDGYVRLVADVLRAVRPDRWVHAVNAGRGGDRSVDLPPRLERDALAHHPDVVAVSIGINDVWRGLDAPGQGLDVPLPTYRTAVADVLDRVGAAGARAIVLTTSIIGEDPESEGNRLLAPYNDALRELTAARGLAVAEVNDAFRRVLAAPHPPQLTTDGVHLTHQGNVALALPVLHALGVSIGDRRRSLSPNYRSPTSRRSRSHSVGGSSGGVKKSGGKPVVDIVRMSSMVVRTVVMLASCAVMARTCSGRPVASSIHTRTRPS